MTSTRSDITLKPVTAGGPEPSIAAPRSPTSSSVAEAAGLVVLHHDHDFDVIAEATGQPAEWIVPAGAIS